MFVCECLLRTAGMMPMRADVYASVDQAAAWAMEEGGEEDRKAGVCH